MGRGDESASSLPTIHSDTIYGAVVYWAFKLFGQDAEAFALNFKTSSLLFKHEGDYLIPKPLLFNTLDLKEGAKAMKQSSYVYLSKLSAEDPLRCVLRESPTLTTKISRNSLDRNTNASFLYFMEVTFVNRGFEPFIVVEFPDEYERMLEASLKALGDHGIGGNATYGLGQFDVELFDLPSEFERDGKYFVTLSLSVPDESEISRLNEGYYTIVQRRGYRKDVAEPKMEVNYLSEGSTFPFPVRGRGVLKIKDYFVQTSPIVIGLGGDWN